MTFVDERPFWAATADPEQDYYFNSLAIVETGFPTSVRHPGTPAHYLGAVVLAVNGTEPSEAQRFFNFTYVLIILLFVASAAAFTKIALKGVPFAPSLLILSSMLLWPSVITYSNYFSVESFLFTVSVLTSAVAYSFLTRRSNVSKNTLIALGILIGLGGAFKFTFAPIGISLGLMVVGATWWSGAGSTRIERSRIVLRHLTTLLLTAAVSFFVFVLPIARHLYELIGRLRIELSRSADSAPILVAGERFVRMAPEYAFLLLFALIGFGVLLGVRKYIQPDSGNVQGATRYIPSTGPTVALFLGLLIFGLILVRSIADQDAVQYADPGVILRNMTPLAGFLPLALLIVWKMYVSTWPRFSDSLFRKRAQNAILIVLSTGLIISSVGGYILWRADTYEEIALSVADHVDAMDAVVPVGSRVAIWDVGESFGAPMFFFWGNYRYAIDQFDEELLTAFPRYTILRVREIPSLASQIDGDERVAPGDGGEGQSEGILRGPAQEIYDSIISSWKEAFPRRSRTRESITGEDGFDDISVVMYRPENIAFVSGGDMADAENMLQRVLEDRFGKVETSYIEIGDETWAVVRMGEQ